MGRGSLGEMAVINYQMVPVDSRYAFSENNPTTAALQGEVEQELLRDLCRSGRNGVGPGCLGRDIPVHLEWVQFAHGPTIGQGLPGHLVYLPYWVR